MKSAEAYGLHWQTDSPIEIELECIRRGGLFEIDGKQYGLGLVEHYQRLEKALWPEVVRNRWGDTLLSNFLSNRITGVMGPANSTKTSSAGRFALLSYFAFPHETTILVSSTDARSLELRIWGEIKKFFALAKRRWPECPGHLIGSRQMIVTAETEDSDFEDDTFIRDYRNGILGIPCVVSGHFVGIAKYCFAAGTLVDTPVGSRSIETIRPGDFVLTASGPNRVVKTFTHLAPVMVRVVTRDGRKIDCTPDHPFFTQYGWVEASNLTQNHRLFTAYETLSILQEGDAQLSPSPKVLLEALRNGQLHEEMQGVRDCIRSQGRKGDFLFKVLRREVEDVSAGYCSSDDLKQRLDSNGQEDQPQHSEQFGGDGTSGYHNGSTDASGTLGDAQAQLENPARSRAEGIWQSREWMPADRSRGYLDGGDARSALEPSDSFRPELRGRMSALLPPGFGVARREAGCGTGRRDSYASQTDSDGPPKGSCSVGTWVDRVEVLKRAGRTRDGGGQEGYRVYNLQVEGHPSYSVNGVIVHNCGIKNKRIFLIADEASFMARAFFDSIANLNKNHGFKAIALGNPQDPGDSLGLICEPHESEGGWDGVIQGVKTTSWRCRMPETRCVQLVGTDSPNFDVPDNVPEPFPFIIGRKAIKNDLEYYGPNSLQFQMMDLGVMPKNAQARRVLTRTLCDEHGVRAQPIWADTQQTQLLGLDASYSAVGGDRTALTHLSFGRGISGRDLAAMLAPPIIIPIKNPKRSPEEQIAIAVREYAEKHNIPPEHVFFDSTGRGTLMSAFARLWSPVVVPIEFGGKASERIVSNVINVPAFEHFSKRVSELWFTVRYLVEADQLCGLTEDVIEEGCMREWGMVAGNRVEVEPKDKTKKRMGRSPDLFDSLCFEKNTMILTPTGERPIQTMKPGDEVITPFGTTTVAVVHESYTDKLTSVDFSNGRNLTGKGEHKIFTSNGWISLDTLTVDNECEGSYNLYLWHLLNAFFGRDERTSFKRLVDIIRTETGRVSRRDFYTGLSGKSTLGIFQKACASIIKTAIGRITGLPILNWWKRANTLATTHESFLATLLSKLGGLKASTFGMQAQPSGINLRQVAHGTALTGKTHGRTEQKIAPFVRSAEPSLVPFSQAGRTFAASDVDTNNDTRKRSPVTGIVLSAGLAFLRTNLGTRKLVPVTVRQFSPTESEKVFNLTLSDHNVYYANGILVSNCAGIEGARTLGLKIQRLAEPMDAARFDNLLRQMADNYQRLHRAKHLQR